MTDEQIRLIVREELSKALNQPERAREITLHTVEIMEQTLNQEARKKRDHRGFTLAAVRAVTLPLARTAAKIQLLEESARNG